MKRTGVVVVSALALALGSGLVLGQDLDVSITLENASQSRAAVADLALPIEQETRPSSAPPEQERRFEPADFARPNRLESLQIAAGDLPRGTTAVAVRCQSLIGIDGTLGDYYCVSDDNRRFEDIVTAVIDAVPAQRFAAARMDGQNVRVLMSFAVFVDCSSGSCLAVSARNHGYHIESLGFDYVDPQPILEANDWYVGFEYKLRWLKEWMPRIANIHRSVMCCNNAVRYVMAVPIDTNGIAASGCLYWLGISNSQASGAPWSAALVPWDTRTALKSAIASLGNVRFVPGMVNGTPTALRLYEDTLTPYPFTAGFPATQNGARAGFGVGELVCK